MTRQAMTDRELRMEHGDLAVEHSNRFRHVADRYPRRVAHPHPPKTFFSSLLMACVPVQSICSIGASILCWSR